MGNGQSTLVVGSKIDSRTKIKQLLAEYHKVGTRKSSIVDSNINRRKFRVTCTAELDKIVRTKKQQRDGIREGDVRYNAYQKECSGTLVMKLQLSPALANKPEKFVAKDYDEGTNC